MMPSVTVTNSIRMNSIRVGVRPGSGLYMVFAHREGTVVCEQNGSVHQSSNSSFVWFLPFFVISGNRCRFQIMLLTLCGAARAAQPPGNLVCKPDSHAFQQEASRTAQR